MIQLGDFTLVIGERINPTGRAALAAELAEGKLDMLLADAASQAAAGADIIDVNVGAAGIDETVLLPRAALAVSEATGLPVCVDSSDPKALSAALAVLPEGTFVNSVTGDSEVLDELLPAAAASGALVIGMTKDHSGIPLELEDRLTVCRRIVEAAGSHGVPPERLLIDFLTMPVASEPGSVSTTLECIRRASTEMGVGSVLGASNISFGMPARPIINSVFLTLAIASGLSAAIVNPMEAGVVQSILAADMLCGRDPRGRRYLTDYRARRRPAIT
ncbi:MAG: dihydropteroate synthase [Candidatus Geothermincolia bacterium]